MAKPDLKARFYFNVQKLPGPDSSGGPLVKKPHLETRIESHQDSKKSSGHVSGNSTISKMKRSHEGWHFRCVAVCNLLMLSLSIVQLGTFPQSMDENMFVLHMVKGHNSARVPSYIIP